MIDINTIVNWTTDDYISEIQKNNAAIRDLLNDNEALLASYKKKRLLTPDEVAEYLQCNPTSIPLSIPYVRVSNRKRFKWADIEKFLADHRVIKGTIQGD
jgi:hypothetical protein